MSLIKPEFGDDLRAALVAGGPEDFIQDDGNPILRQRSVLLYAILAGLTTGKPKLILKVLRDSRNGFEAWRLINREYQPADSAARKLQVAMEISEGKDLHVQNAAQFGAALMNWEEKIKAGHILRGGT